MQARDGVQNAAQGGQIVAVEVSGKRHTKRRYVELPGPGANPGHQIPCTRALSQNHSRGSLEFRRGYDFRLNHDGPGSRALIDQ